MNYAKIARLLKKVVKEMEQDSIYETEFKCMMHCSDCPCFVGLSYGDECLHRIAKAAISSIENNVE